MARFYYRYGIPVATANRLNYLLATYPELVKLRPPRAGGHAEVMLRDSRLAGYKRP